MLAGPQLRMRAMICTLAVVLCPWIGRTYVDTEVKGDNLHLGSFLLAHSLRIAPP